MGYALIGGGINTGNLATNAFAAEYTCGGGVGNTTEANSARIQRIPGTFSNYGAFCASNSTGRTLQYRKNSGNANGLLTFTSNTAQSQYDSVNTDAYAANDTRDYKVTVAAGGISFVWTKAMFVAASGHATVHFAAATFGSTTTAFSPIHSQVNGSATLWTTTEANAQCKMRTSGNWQFGWISVTTATTTTATVISRKNGANGNMSISIPLNTTGIFEDTSNSDSFGPGDLLNWQCSGQSAGLVMMNGISSWLSYSGVSNEVICGIDVSSPVVSSGFIPICATAHGATASEAQAQLQHGFAGVSTNLRGNVITNTASAGGTLRYRVNGVNGNQNVTIPASTTGYFEDTVNVDAFGATDNVAINFSTAGVSGAITLGPVLTTESPSIVAPISVAGFAEVES